MFVVVLIIHILVCFALMAVVLMQSGKGRGLAGAFGGGGGNQTLFGGRGAVDFLGKATWILGALFMVTSLSLALMSGTRAGSTPAEGLIKKEAPAGAPAGMPPAGSAVPSDATPGSTAPGGAAPGGSAPAGQPAPASSPFSAPAGQPAGK